MTWRYRVVHTATRLFGKVWCGWKVIGAENVPRSGGVILASNHVSFLDPPLVGSAIKRECAFMARHTLWHNPTLARWLPHLNAFPVDRDRPDRKSIRTALDYLDKGFPLVLFPEGTRSPDGRLAPAEPGLALLVQKSGAPVVPVALIGPETVLGPGMKRPRRAKIKVVFGRPIFFTPDSSREEILTHTMEAIAQLMTEHGRPMQPASRSEAPASAESAVPED